MPLSQREAQPDETEPGPAGPRPGQLSALLRDLVRAPQQEGPCWSPALRAGATIARFELIRELGRGGFGIVWEARDRDLGRAVAFKAVCCRTEVVEDRLMREAEAAARLSHPNIVTLFDVGRSEHGPYLVLELLEGRTLEERLSDGRLSVREAVRVAVEIAKGVSHAHAKGVVHRDLKPANVFLCDDGQVKVLDFGLAHAFGQRRLDGGTPAYMAPEQWEGAPEDERTDVFAMGVLLYRLLSGELPFPDDGGKSAQGPRPAPVLDVPELPALGELVARMLQKQPVQRPRDGGAVAAALRSLQAELERTSSTGAAPVTTRPRAGLPGLLSELKRRRVVPAMVGYGAFALVALRSVDWLSQSGRVGPWAPTVALVLLGLGFPASLFLAWTYDLTGQGIRRTEPPGTTTSEWLRPRRARLALLLASVGLLAAVPGLVYYVAFRQGAPPRPVADAEGRVVVAIADVVNETGEKELDVLSGLLVTSLEQSRKLTVMTQARVLDLAMRAGRKASRVDETIGREVGRAYAVRALLLPAIRRLGTTYSLEMRVLDPMSDRHLFTLSDRATSRDALLELLDRLSERTRTQLGEGTSEIAGASVQLGQAVTRSLEAYQHYVSGLDAWYRDGSRSAGLEEFKEAVRLDPQFAAAHEQLRLVYSVYGRPDLAAPHARTATEYQSRMPAKERGLLRLKRGLPYDVEYRDQAEMLRTAAELEARFPDDKFVLTFVAGVLGEPDLDRRAEAERIARKALALDPGYTWAARVIQNLLGDRRSEGLEIARRAVSVRRNAANLALLAEAEIAAGSPEAATTLAREALQQDGSRNSLVVLNACGVLNTLAGRPACIAELTALLAAGPNEHEKDLARFQLVSALAIEGRRREALRLAATVPEERRGDPGELARVLAIGLPRADALEARNTARRIANRYVRRYQVAWYGGEEEPLGGERVEIAEQLFTPVRLARAGRHAEAAEIEARNRDWALAHNDEGTLDWHAYFLAEQLFAAGRYEEASRVQRGTTPGRGLDLVDRAENGPRLSLVRTRALGELGRTAEAIHELDDVIAFWKQADHDLPLLVEAKLMRKRLANVR